MHYKNMLFKENVAVIFYVDGLQSCIFKKCKIFMSKTIDEQHKKKDLKIRLKISKLLCFFLRDWKIAQASFPSSSFMYLLYFIFKIHSSDEIFNNLLTMQQFFNLSRTHKSTLFTSENRNRGERDENYVMPEMKMKRFLLKWMAIADRQI